MRTAYGGEAWLTAGLAAAAVGELSIPAVVPLRPAQVARLRQRVAADAAARELGETVRQAAEPFLAAEPRPLAVIHYEGLVNTDPQRIATVGDLDDMVRAAWLLRHWQASEDDRAAAALRRLVTAWAGDGGPALYDWVAPAGGSLRKSVDYVVPCALGTKRRQE